MKKKVLIHPGFHKTGTTTLQRGLKARREAMQQQLDMLILDDIRPAALLSKRYSHDRRPRTLAKFSEVFASILAAKDPSDSRPLIISSEGLVGQIPGRTSFQSYMAAPVLLNHTVKAVQELYRDQAEITLWFTTRDKEAWQRSVYYQNVRTARVTEDFEEYRIQLNDAPDLEDVIKRVHTQMPESVDVCYSSLEVAQDDPLGLMGIAFELLGVPPPDQTPPKIQNAHQPGLLQELLDLNRSSLVEPRLSEEKHKVLARYRKQN